MSSFSCFCSSPCKSCPSVRATQVPAAAYIKSIQISSLVVSAFTQEKQTASSQLLLLLSLLTLKLGSVVLSVPSQWFPCDTNHREWAQKGKMGFYASYAGPTLTHIAHSFTCTLFCWGQQGGIQIYEPPAAVEIIDTSSSSNKCIALWDSKVLGSIHAARTTTVEKMPVGSLF